MGEKKYDCKKFIWRNETPIDGCRALVHEPDILILDEPTAGVDIEIRHQMWAFLQKINQEGKTIILTTHYLEEVEQLCKNVAMIKNGKIIHQVL